MAEDAGRDQVLLRVVVMVVVRMVGFVLRVSEPAELAGEVITLEDNLPCRTVDGVGAWRGGFIGAESPAFNGESDWT
jgi:hypothetical protein